ncbi:MAG: sigma-54 dependent transcriptional regulator [Sulfuritalea sp.]|nr:sigma-54 dependent transcriptional regulator [Sulfuritalea sp.]
MSSVPAVATVELLPWQHQSVLVVDDEPGMVSFLHRSLALRCGWVATAGSVEEAAELLSRRHFDLIVLDIALPGRSGVEWLHDLRAQGFAGDVVLMTAYADLETAIDALRAGASDFLLKPFSVAQMLNAIKRCFERSSLRRENFVLRRELDQRDDSVEGMVGKSAVIRDVCARIKRIAPTPSTVLIHGESGTGKELAARALHRMSLRAEGPFVPINCAAIAEDLIESELFGHVKGAFTGAAAGREGLFYYASGGTLFLDEISELPLPLQAKLLRVLEERKVRPVGSEQEVPVDVRVVAATNRNLAEEIAAGRFRRDLYYRLQVVEVVLPPLRERIEDLPDLVDYFIGQLAARLGVAELAHDEAALARLARYSWPGNVRELKNLIERSLILGYYADDFAPNEEAAVTCPRSGIPGTQSDAAPSAGDTVSGCAGDITFEPSGEESLATIERRHILGVLDVCKGNKSEAARKLGVSRKTLERKCSAWGV